MRQLLICVSVMIVVTGFVIASSHKSEESTSGRLCAYDRLASSGDEDKCSTDIKKKEEKIRGLFEEITLLNLINGLNLTEEQIKQIIQCNKKIQLLREQTEQINNKTIEDIIDAYTTLESTLEKNAGIPPDIEHRAYTMEQKGKEILKELLDSVVTIEKKLTGILLDSQVEIINTFNPCLIPPKDLKNPVRAGQVENGQAGLDLLRRIRNIPYEVFEDRKSEMVERYLDRVQEHVGKLTDDEKKKESERSFKIMEQVRAMSNKEFELNGPDLVREFVNDTKKTLQKDKELEQEIEQIHQTRHGGLSRIGRYLLNPRIVPILEKRLELMRNPKQIAPADLDKIKTR